MRSSSFKRTLPAAALLCLLSLAGAAHAGPGDGGAPEQVEVASWQGSDDFTNRLVARMKEMYPDGDGEVEVVQFEGLRPDKRLMRSIQTLLRAGIQVKGVLVTREQFESMIEASDEEAYRLNYLPDRSSGLLTRFQKAFAEYFGAPGGIALFGHFRVRGEDGKLKARFGKPEDVSKFKKLGAVTSGVMVAGMLAPMIFSHDGLTASRVVVTSALLAGLAFFSTRATQELNSLKMQGRLVGFRKGASPDSDLEIDFSKTIFGVGSFVWEMAVNSLLTSTLYGFATAWSQLGTSFGNAILAPYSYIPIEGWKARILAEAQKLEADAKAFEGAGRPDLAREATAKAAKLFSKYKWVHYVFWFALYPAAQKFQLNAQNLFPSLPAWIAVAPLATAGTVGIVAKAWPNLSWENMKKAWDELWDPPAAACEALLRVRRAAPAAAL